VAVQPVQREVEEPVQLQPYVDELMRLVYEADPGATYSLEPPIDPGIWLLNVFVRPPLDGDPDFLAAVTDRAVDFLINDGVSIAVIPLGRQAAEQSA
jgi:hypothetical protein